MQGNRMCLEAADFVSDTSLGCMVVQGFQGSRRATVTAENRSGSVIHAWSTDVPDLSVIQVDNQQATGLVWVTILGTSIGNMVSKGLTPEKCTRFEAMEWVSDTFIRKLRLYIYVV